MIGTVSERSIGGRALRYVSAGHGDEIAVLLQGWHTQSELYEDIVDTLAQRYTVLFPLLPGFGETPEPDEPMCVADYAALVIDFLSALHVTKAVFFCHSFGGRVFFHLLSSPGSPIQAEKVILCDVAGVMRRKSLFQRWKLRHYKWGYRLLESRPLRRFFHEKAERFRERHASEDYRNASPVMRQTLVLAVNEDLCERFPLLTMPTLILWGRNDTAVPLSDAYRIESDAKDAAVVVFENSGHFPFLTEKPRFLAVVRSFFQIESPEAHS